MGIFLIENDAQDGNSAAEVIFFKLLKSKFNLFFLNTNFSIAFSTKMKQTYSGKTLKLNKTVSKPSKNCLTQIM